jgi:hypothetical protein
MARRRTRRAAAKTTVATDAQFEHELEVFPTDGIRGVGTNIRSGLGTQCWPVTAPC